MKMILIASLFLILSVFSVNALDLTLDELKQYNGVDKPERYIAVDGIIYDVTFHPRFNGQCTQQFHCQNQQSLRVNKGNRHMKGQLPVVGKIITK